MENINNLSIFSYILFKLQLKVYLYSFMYNQVYRSFKTTSSDHSVCTILSGPVHVFEYPAKTFCPKTKLQLLLFSEPHIMSSKPTRSLKNGLRDSHIYSFFKVLSPRTLSVVTIKYWNCYFSICKNPLLMQVYYSDLQQRLWSGSTFIHPGFL